ncbi:hypothetical protein HGA32_00375 [Candidatus Gracilibacteria bacterium]|nr:hypothetical protein [Candidatus Gracilibacteria bacterium]
MLAITAFGADTANIEKVTVMSPNSLKMTLTGTIDLADDTLEGDIKVLKDLSIQKVEKSPVAENIINITLSEELTPDTNYSILSVFGAEGNMDFALGKNIKGAEFINTDSENPTIDKLVVKDSTEIDIYYKIGLIGEEFEYKVLSGVGIEGISKYKTDITLNTKNSFTSDSEYIIMLISLKDVFGKELSFNDGIFDFETQEISEEALQLLSESGAIVEEGLNSAKEEEKGNLKEVAMNTPHTPDTGAETWVLILGTLIINTFFTYSRRKKAKTA